jgi:hypothetical protein
LFGADDCPGLLNLQTPERVAAAARLVRTGEVYSLNAPVEVPAPALFGRGPLRHTLIPIEGRASFDDKLDNFYPQASSQWDSLAHVAYDADQFCNGASSEDITVRARNTIGHWAERGIAGRGVLIDIDAFLGGAGCGGCRTWPAPAAATGVSRFPDGRAAQRHRRRRLARQRTRLQVAAGQVTTR